MWSIWWLYFCLFFILPFCSFVCLLVAVVAIISEKKLYLALEKEILTCWDFTRESFKDRDESWKFLLLGIFTTELIHPLDIFQWSLLILKLRPSLIQRKFGRPYKKNWMSLRAGVIGMGWILAIPNTSLHISELMMRTSPGDHHWKRT